jgi:hypothetical protein
MFEIELVLANLVKPSRKFSAEEMEAWSSGLSAAEKASVDSSSAKGKEIIYVSAHKIPFLNSSLDFEELTPITHHRWHMSASPPPTTNLMPSGAANTSII